jgi:hypothetical protein
VLFVVALLRALLGQSAPFRSPSAIYAALRIVLSDRTVVRRAPEPQLAHAQAVQVAEAKMFV